MGLIDIHSLHVHADDRRLKDIINSLKRIEEKMATQADIDALKAQADKINEELRLQREANAAAAEALRAEIARLEEIIRNGVELDLEPLRAALQILDDINPDAPPAE